MENSRFDIGLFFICRGGFGNYVEGEKLVVKLVL